MMEEICKNILLFTAFIAVMIFLGSFILYIMIDLIPNILGIEINKQVKKIVSKVEHFLTEWACNVGYVFILEYVIFGFVFIILRR